MATKTQQTDEEIYEPAEDEATDFERITFNWHGAPYTLEFSRETAKIAEQQYGITLNTVREGKVSNLPEFFYCALLMHHRRIKTSVAYQMFEDMGNKSDLFLALTYLYANSVNTLMSEPDEGNAVSWQRV